MFFNTVESVKNEEIVHVGKGTHIEGNVEANKLVVEGSISGTMHVDKLIVRKGAVIRGTVFTYSLLLDEGATCNCELHLDRVQQNTEEVSSVSGVIPEEKQEKVASLAY